MTDLLTAPSGTQCVDTDNEPLVVRHPWNGWYVTLAPACDDQHKGWAYAAEHLERFGVRLVGDAEVA